MKTHPKSTAVILFARRAEDEAIHKQLLPDKKKNLLLLNELISHSKSTATAANLTFYHFHEGNQAGVSFGERLSEAISSIFKKGHKRVIVIGGDCPELCASDLIITAELLERQHFVIGPDQGGGVYLLGLTSDKFQAKAFENLQWNTPQLFDDLISYAASNTEKVHLLETRFDLNSSFDLLSHAKGSPFINNVLKKLFSELFNDRESKTPPVISYRYSKSGRRGPPQLA